MEFRIGERDAETGLYAVIWPDGSSTLNGIKIFNAEHQFGDVVQATRRSDGMMVLDGPKATQPLSATTEIVEPKFGEQQDGYLNGQLFNNEEDLLPILSINLAPNRDASIRSGGSSAVRVSIDRPLSRELRYKISLSGSAVYLTDYTLSVDPSVEIVLEVRGVYHDILIDMIPGGFVEQQQTIVVGLSSSARYRIGKPNVMITILTTSFKYQIYRRTTDIENPVTVLWTLLVDGPVEILSSASIAAADSAWVATVEIPTYSDIIYRISYPDPIPGDPGHWSTDPGRSAANDANHAFWIRYATNTGLSYLVHEFYRIYEYF